MAEIRAFNTHIEIYPYKRGDCELLEKQLSKKKMISKYKKIFKMEPFAYYIQNDILYIPRGVNTSQLEIWFSSMITKVLDSDPYGKIRKGVPSDPPKTPLQSDAIDFLSGEGKFLYSKRYPQLGLNLKTGAGKTYAAICAVLRLKMKAIMITHRDAIRMQWYNTLVERTSMDPDQICRIEDLGTIDAILRGDIKADFYLISHALIAMFANDHGWHKIREFFQKAKIGIKIIDEAHKHAKDTLMVDFFSNTEKTFYLTATFGRVDTSENTIYKRIFSSVARFGENESNSERKHTIAYISYFQSRPKYAMIPSMESSHGFSVYKYIDYEFGKSDGKLLRSIAYILQETEHLEGKTLITTPKIESSEFLAQWLKENGYQDVYAVNSSHPSKDNEYAKENARYISSTLGSFSEGLDVKGLRVIINAEPIRTKINMNQFVGRLREYAPDKNTYFYHLVDLSIPKMSIWVKNITPELQSECEKVLAMHLEEYIGDENS